jgi:hypothetical protein
MSASGVGRSLWNSSYTCEMYIMTQMSTECTSDGRRFHDEVPMFCLQWSPCCLGKLVSLHIIQHAPKKVCRGEHCCISSQERSQYPQSRVRRRVGDWKQYEARRIFSGNITLN